MIAFSHNTFYFILLIILVKTTSDSQMLKLDFNGKETYYRDKDGRLQS